MTTGYTLKDAWITQDNRYRYLLRRAWQGRGPFAHKLAFIMLNPSTADDARDDPTIRACVSIAKRFGYNSIHVANLYSFRSPNPWALRGEEEPIGTLTDSVLQHVHTQCHQTIAAWGTHGGWNNRGRLVTEMLVKIKPLYTIGINASGEPRHPLRTQMPEKLTAFKYVGYNAVPIHDR